MFDTSHQAGGGSAAQTLPPFHCSQDDSLTRELLEHVCRLRLIRPVIIVSVMSLHRRGAEADADIASVLSESAGHPLDCEIARVESILASHTWRRGQEAQA